jgi:hypothetical protein
MLHRFPSARYKLRFSFECEKSVVYVCQLFVNVLGPLDIYGLIFEFIAVCAYFVGVQCCSGMWDTCASQVH